MPLKLTFKIIDSNELEAVMAFSGDFNYKPFNARATMTDTNRTAVDTMTGMRGDMLDEVQAWCLLNNCGSQYEIIKNFGGYPLFGFDTEEKLAFLMVRWA